MFNLLGLEYHSSPTSRSSGFITWQADGEISYSVGAGAVGPDTGDDGSQVDQRLISEEPMVSIVYLLLLLTSNDCRWCDSVTVGTHSEFSDLESVFRAYVFF